LHVVSHSINGMKTNSIQVREYGETRGYPYLITNKHK